MNKVLYSSNKSDWETPHAFFAALDAEFGFTLDACATDENAKVRRWITPAMDALKYPWVGVVWMNPPYGYQIGRWVRKSYEEAQIGVGAVVVGLIPAKTETSWWHDYVMKAEEIRLIRGRLRFSGSPINAPLPSAVVVWRQGNYVPRFTTMNRILDPKETVAGQQFQCVRDDPRSPAPVSLGA